MEDYLPIIVPVIGIAGVVIGVLLNEFMRRRNRRELYAPKIFEKRLAAYEGLIEEINKGSNLARELIEDGDFTQEQRHELISNVIQTMAEFVDKNSLYLGSGLVLAS